MESTTKTAPIMTEKIPYLDHGYVQVLDYHMTEGDIARAARGSYNADEYEDDSRNSGLVRYLVRHHHTSPLEMASVTFRIKVPIFVARQHVRHRTARLNEQSLRYVVHDGDFYTPDFRKQDPKAKQGSLKEITEDNEMWKGIWRDTHEKQYALYKEMVNSGIAREQARGVLSTSFYTTIMWQMDLNNLRKYLVLRLAPDAQAEIVELAQIMLSLVFDRWPNVFQDLKDQT